MQQSIGFDYYFEFFHRDVHTNASCHYPTGMLHMQYNICFLFFNGCFSVVVSIIEFIGMSNLTPWFNEKGKLVWDANLQYRFKKAKKMDIPRVWLSWLGPRFESLFGPDLLYMTSTRTTYNIIWSNTDITTQRVRLRFLNVIYFYKKDFFLTLLLNS